MQELVEFCAQRTDIYPGKVADARRAMFRGIARRVAQHAQGELHLLLGARFLGAVEFIRMSAPVRTITVRAFARRDALLDALNTSADHEDWWLRCPTGAQVQVLKPAATENPEIMHCRYVGIVEPDTG